MSETHRPAGRDLFTTDDVVSLGISRDLLYKWKARGYLTRYGSSRNALWDWPEIALCLDKDKTCRRRVA